MISVFLAMAAMSLGANAKSVQCSDFKIILPSKISMLPVIESDLEMQAALFSFRDNNLIAVAMDSETPDRFRMSVSAQLDKKTGKYHGQVIQDFGGREIQLENGPEVCSVVD